MGGKKAATPPPRTGSLNFCALALFCRQAHCEISDHKILQRNAGPVVDCDFFVRTTPQHGAFNDLTDAASQIGLRDHPQAEDVLELTDGFHLLEFVVEKRSGRNERRVKLLLASGVGPHRGNMRAGTHPGLVDQGSLGRRGRNHDIGCRQNRLALGMSVEFKA